MIRIIHFFIKQRLFINLMVTLLALGGVFTLTRMNREAFPDVNFDMVTVTTIYPGGSPDEIEQLITIPIEKELRGVIGIDKLKSYNIENVSVLVVYLDSDLSDEAHKNAVDDVQDAVESVENLPEKAERPVIEEITLDKAPAIDVAIGLAQKEPLNDESYRDLRQTAKALEDYLYEIKGVAEIERLGYLEREFLVEVNPSALSRYNIGMNTVINKLATSNLDLPGGVLRLDDKEYLLRTKEQFKNPQDVRETVVLANDYGFLTRINDIARVQNTFEEPDILEEYNGENSIILKVSKKKSADMITITDNIKQALQDFKPPNDRKVNINYFNDFSRQVRDRLSSLITNGITGFILLALILLLLLGPRLSMVVGMAIPVTFMVAFMGMDTVGITINVISMFALVMVLGMIVDFSIVVAENSYRHMEDGWSKKDAVEKGTAEVFWPLTVTLLCIAAAFGPLLFMTGIVGKFVFAIPVVIIICLSASWFAAMFILPNHLETFARAKPKKKDAEGNSEKSGGFDVINRAYKRFLSTALRHRYITLGVLLVMFFGSLFVAGRFLGFVFFPDEGGETIEIRTKLPQGTTLKANQKALGQVTEVVLNLPEIQVELPGRPTPELLKEMRNSIRTAIPEVVSGFEALTGRDAFSATESEDGRFTLSLRMQPVGTRNIAGEEILSKVKDTVSGLDGLPSGVTYKMFDELSSLHTRIGEEMVNPTDPKPSQGTHRGTLIVHLTPDGDRERDARIIMQQLRTETERLQKAGEIRPDLKLDYRVQAGGPPVGLPVNVEIRGDNLDTLQKIAEEYLAELKNYEGVYDPEVDLEPGKEEFRYKINEARAARAGVSVLSVAQALNSSFDGTVATTINIGEDEVDVRVRFPDWARQRKASLDDVRIANKAGGLVPLSLVADYNRQPGYAEINRLDYKRVVIVSANVNSDQITSLEVNTRLENKFSDISERYPGYTVNYGGEQEESQESMANLGVLFLFALFIIYIVLSSFFRSLILPTVVMSAIPFALVGVILALLTHGKPLSFMSTLGVVSLAGVIVSNTLVLVQFINNLRADGFSLFDALVEGGSIRLRPVLLTSGTTVLGLFPTIYGLGGDDPFVAPLALAFGYGLIFATLVTLVIVPAFYHIAEDVKGLMVKIPAMFGIQMSPSLFTPDED